MALHQTPFDPIEPDPVADRADLICGIVAAVIVMLLAIGVLWGAIISARDVADIRAHLASPAADKPLPPAASSASINTPVSAAEDAAGNGAL